MRNWEIKMKPDGRTFKYIYDEAAETMRCDPMPTEEELSYWYATSFNYGWFEKRALLKKIQAWHRWEVIKNKLKKGAIKF